MMKHAPLFVILAVALSGCGVMNRLKPAPKAPPVEIVAPVEETVTLPPLGEGQSAAALDDTSAAEKAAALAKPAAAGERELGKTTVALGNPAEQGIWLKTPFVTVAGKGRVVTASGASVAVDLIPGTGASLQSLAAYRALGLGLTDLPEVTVYAN